MQITILPDSDFTLANIPFGIASIPNRGFRAVTRLGDHVIDLFDLANAGLFEDITTEKNVFCQQYLNDFIELGKPVTKAIRNRIAESFTLKGETATAGKLPATAILSLKEIEMQMPVFVRDYTDFYSSKDHATNVGTMFRDPANALLPNWTHLPVGYHGRASSIIPSGVAIHRPKGQTMPDGADKPVFGPCRLLDFELEVGFIVGKSTQMGESISTANAEDHIFGLVLFNDWSARDIQKWEYVPLGPFLAKNFASSISPWIVTLEALEPFRTSGEKQHPAVLPYLEFEGKKNYNVNLEVDIITPSGEKATVCNSNFRYMYWNMCQQLAHHTVNGCNFNVGDMCASGTISGPEPHEYGSMLEISWKGTRPLKMPDGSERRFIQDGDTVVMRGFAGKGSSRVGFGEVSTKVLPALD
jgi:fumarylacetoacetase